MDRNDQGNEDTTRAAEHTHNAQENRDALAAQNRRTEATAGDSANHPIGDANATGRASEDTSQAAANTSNAQQNRDALAEQNRRTEETAPDSVHRPIGDNG